MENLISDILDHLNSKVRYLELFAQYDTRVESWLKAELLYILQNAADNNKLRSFELEFATPDRKRIDFKIDRLNGSSIFLEIKAFCISKIKTSARDMAYYMRPGRSFYQDFSKLERLNLRGSCYIIQLIYPAPSEELWTNTVLPTTFEYFPIWECLSELTNRTFHLALWKKGETPP